MILFMTYTIGSLTVFTVKRLNRIKEARDSRKLEEV